CKGAMKLAMSKIRAAFRSNEAGATAVEMACVTPILLLFILGIIAFARAYWVLDSMQLAVDEAGRYAMVHIAASDSQIISTAKANLYGLDSSDFTVTSRSQTSGGVTYKVITATYTFNFIASRVLPYGNITLSRATTVPLIP